MAATGLIVAFLVALALGRLAIAFGPALGFVDLPDEDLKTHDRVAVPLGGLGVYLGLVIGTWVAGALDAGLAVASSVIWILGVIDDRVQLQPWTRLVGTAIAGLALGVLSDFGEGWLVVLGVLVTTLIAVNAWNLLDGLDSLAGSVALVAAAGLAVHAALVGTVSVPWAAAILGAAVLGFLVWNLPPARLFLGDSGAYTIGVALVWAAWRSGEGAETVLVGLALIGVPFLELGATMLRRIRASRPLFGGDRNHSYDVLAQAGWSLPTVAIVYALVQAAWAALLLVSSLIWGNWPTVVIALSAAAVVVYLAARFRQGVGLSP